MLQESISAEEDAGLRSLSNKTVTVIGMGVGASIVALLLTLVDRFRLVDFDRLSEDNIETGHVLTFDDVGKSKVEATKQLLLRKSRTVEVETFPFDVTSMTGTDVDAVFDGADLVVAAVDSRAQFFINEVCYERRVPLLIVNYYRGLWGGRTRISAPGEDALL